MSASGGFHDLLFELSNENRYEILVSLRKNVKRITDITREMDLKTPEARRHVSRLGEVGLIQRDIDGYYHLTSYGETVLISLKEFNFMSRHKDYLISHNINKIPRGFLKQIGELEESKRLESVMDFLRHAESLFKESKEYVWLLVDQFPLNSLSTIIEAIKRGVQFKIIELKDRVFSPDLDFMTTEETQVFSLARITPLVEQKMLDEVNVFLFLSDVKCVLAFPTSDGQFDYKGFTATNESSLFWCRELFQFYWENAETRTALHDVEVKRTPLIGDKSKGSIVVTGAYRSDVDVQALQDAVDHYDEVILKGSFNLGNSTIYINRSVVLQGEGRENDVPTTKLSKMGWQFPTHQQEFLLIVRGDEIDVRIENIHFTSFNNCCIWNWQGNSCKILNNRFTIDSGLGHGTNLGNWGDELHVIASGGDPQLGGFPGGILIEGNYIDLARSKPFGGIINITEEEEKPDYRPKLAEHESYIGIGILLNHNLGKVVVRNNIIRNANSKGILIADNWVTAELLIHNNKIFTEVSGSYAYGNHNAGFGIFVQSSMNNPSKGSKVEIFENEITCTKINYCGIGVYGPWIIDENSGKLEECLVHDNEIDLSDGSVGIYVRKSDYTEISDNKITGKAYYGIQISGRADRNGMDLGACYNVVEDNDLSYLEIKTPDEYSDNHVDGRMFTGSEGKSKTAHVWLNEYSSRNTVKIRENEGIIDEGSDNEVIRESN